MSHIPVLRGLRVSSQEASVHLGWGWAGARPPLVRVLRSMECFCESPEAHRTGEWGQELLYEGHGSQLLDAQASRSQTLYYSIFARARARAPWRHPIQVCVRKIGYEPPALGVLAAEGSPAASLYAPGRLIGERYVEITGSEEAPPVVGGSRDWLLLVVPIATLVLLSGFLRGMNVRLLTTAALALAACWRLLDGVHPDLRRFLAYLRVVALVDVLFWLAALLFSFFVAFLPASQVQIKGSILLFWLYPLLLLAAMAGVWLFMSRALDDQGRPVRPLPYLGLAPVEQATPRRPPLANDQDGALGLPQDSPRHTPEQERGDRRQGPRAHHDETHLTSLRLGQDSRGYLLCRGRLDFAVRRHARITQATHHVAHQRQSLVTAFRHNRARLALGHLADVQDFDLRVGQPRQHACRGCRSPGTLGVVDRKQDVPTTAGQGAPRSGAGEQLLQPIVQAAQLAL